jgi:hypothetical protein
VSESECTHVQPPAFDRGPLARPAARFAARALVARVLLGAVCVAPGFAQDDAAAEKPAAAGEHDAQRLSPDVRKVLDRWAETVRDLRTLRVEFEQDKYLKYLRKPRTSRGVTLLVGRQMLMQVFAKDGALETAMSLRGDELRILYPSLGKLEIYPVDPTTPRSSPFPLLVDDLDALARDQDLRVERPEGEDEDVAVLVMTPKPDEDEGADEAEDGGRGRRSPPTADIVEVRIRFENGRMTEVAQRGRSGSRNVMRIRAFEVNGDLDVEDLRLEIPEGTEVIRIVPPEPKADADGSEDGKTSGGPAGRGDAGKR